MSIQKRVTPLKYIYENQLVFNVRSVIRVDLVGFKLLKVFNGPCQPTCQRESWVSEPTLGPTVLNRNQQWSYTPKVLG